jgi:hypothetical protein
MSKTTTKQISIEVYEAKCPICEKVFQERYKNSLDSNMENHIKACAKKRLKLNPEVKTK